MRKGGLTDDFVGLARREIRTRFDSLDRLRERLVAGADAEAVHQTRIEIRRLRSLFRTMRRYAPSQELGAVDAGLRDFGRTLGAVRDADVQLMAVDSLEPGAWRSAYRDHLVELRGVHAKALARDLVGDDHAALWRRFERFAARPPHSDRHPSVGKVARRELSRLLRRLHKRGNRITRDTAPEGLHDLRIRVKRYRYLLEWFAPHYGKALDADVRAAKRLQDLLGRHQDACVAADRLTRYRKALTEPLGEDHPDIAALTKAIEREGRKARACRTRFGEEWRRFVRRVQPAQLMDRLAA